MNGIDYSRIPEHMRNGMQLYIEKGIPPEDFLYAILSNDFMAAAGQADDINQKCLFEWASFVYNELPMNCHGNKKMVDEWIAQGGM